MMIFSLFIVFSMTYDANTIMKFMYKYFNGEITIYIIFISGNNVKVIVLMKQ